MSALGLDRVTADNGRVWQVNVAQNTEGSQGWLLHSRVTDGETKATTQSR